MITRNGIEVNATTIIIYFETVQTLQQKHDGLILKMPELPKTDEKTAVVLKAYRNMARCWSNAGGSVLNPMHYLDILYIMGRNHIYFNGSRRR